MCEEMAAANIHTSSSFTFKGLGTKHCVFANPQKWTNLTC